MAESNIELLQHAVGVLIGQEHFTTTVERLREELRHTGGLSSP